MSDTELTELLLDNDMLLYKVRHNITKLQEQCNHLDEHTSDIEVQLITSIIEELQTDIKILMNRGENAYAEEVMLACITRDIREQLECLDIIPDRESQKILMSMEGCSYKKCLCLV